MVLNRRLVAGVLFLGLVTWFVACSKSDNEPGGSDDPANEEGMVLRRGNGADPGSLDPHKSVDTYSAEILRDLYEGLVGESADAELTPAGASSWQISEDALEYTFTLRPDAHWSNGDPVTAQDYATGLRRAVDPNTASRHAQLLAPIKNALKINAGELPLDELGVRVKDKYTLVVTLESPTSYFLGLLTASIAYPIHSPSLSVHGDRFTRPGNLVSNGPYELVEFVAQSHVKLRRNERYWDNDAISIDTVYFYNTEDITSEFTRYRAGELDFTEQIPDSQYKRIKETMPGELHVAPVLNMYYYMFDLSQPPFKDNQPLRQALSMVIDRDVLVNNVMGLGQLPAYGLVPPGTKNHALHTYDWADLSMDQRIDRAMELYAEAGYSEAKPLTVNLLYNSGENHKKLAAAVAVMWKDALGVKTTLRNEEWKVFLQSRLNPELWDTIRFSWLGDYDDPNTFLEIFGSKHRQNIAGYDSDAFDGLLGAAAAEIDGTRRTGLLRQAEHQFMSDYVIAPVYYYVSKHLVKPYVKGYETNIMDRNQTRYYRIEH